MRLGANSACYECPNSDAGSTFTPGPMVEEMATRLMKVPLAPAGRAFCTASANALMFCTRWSAENDALPTPACTMPAFSTRNSTDPPLAPLTALVTSMVTVPTLGFGIMPRGPNTLPSRPTSGMRSGVAMQRSKSMLPPCTLSTRSSAPTTSAPAALASSALAPRANTPTRKERPVPFGSSTTPRTIWSAWRGSTPRLMATSIVSSNFAFARSLTILMASASGYIFSRSTPSRAFFKRFPMLMAPSPRNFQTHRAGRTLDHLHGRFDGVAIQVLHLLLGDLAHLRLGHFSGLVAARRLRPRLDFCSLLEEVGHRRRLHLEGEGTVRVDGDDHRDRGVLLFLLGLRVERLAELHNVETALTKRGTDRRRRVRRPRRDLQFQVS